MTDLFKHRWTNQEGEQINHDGTLSDNFKLWARKTSQLTDSEWTFGFEELERRIEKASAQGETLYPPTYPEFLGICRPTKSPNGVNGAAYVEFKPMERLTDKTQAAKNKAAGRKHLDALMGRK